MNNNIPSPCFVCSEELLENNLSILKKIQEQSGVNILLALKGFAMYSTFDICQKYLVGCCASGLNEAILAKEKFKKEVHTYSSAYKQNEFEQIVKISNHIIFNSFNQYNLYKDKTIKQNSLGLRVNPQVSTVATELYNPCGSNSRLGIKINDFPNILPAQIEGLHFHALCEQNVDDLQKVLDRFEKDFNKYFSSIKWVNFGGGHHITRKNYDVKTLIKLLKNFRLKYPNLTIYLEPGEAIGWQTGYLSSTILDIVHNEKNIAILDTSAECHMPDTLAMPYKAQVRGASNENIKQYNYILAGNSCLAGDIMGTYSFDKPLNIGDKIIFEDMIHYTMVKTTTFNGINLPSIAIHRKNGNIELIRSYGYESYIDRLS